MNRDLSMKHEYMMRHICRNQVLGGCEYWGYDWDTVFDWLYGMLLVIQHTADWHYILYIYIHTYIYIYNLCVRASVVHCLYTLVGIYLWDYMRIFHPQCGICGRK